MKRTTGLFCIILILILSGCIRQIADGHLAGTDTIAIETIPSGASLNKDGEYICETPCTIPFRYSGPSGGEKYNLTLSKSGYHSTTIPFERSMLFPKFNSGNYQSGSKYGAGNTFTFTYKLSPTAVSKTPKFRKKSPPIAASMPPLLSKKYSGQNWAVIIGISDYEDTRIPSLRYASSDAQSFYKWATSPDGGKYAPSMVKLLIDQDATGRNIKNALFIWLKQALQEDVVTIYFAGHGSPESPDSPNNLFLLPYDAKYDEIASSGFPMWDIETALKRYIKAKKVVVIADACHSGGVGQSFDIARRGNRGIEINQISSGLQNLSQIGDGVAVISASDDKQFSQESQKWGGGFGVFTYFLLEGLKGEADYNKDTRVTLGELIPYLSEQVRRETRNAQSPTVAGRFDPALSIGR